MPGLVALDTNVYIQALRDTERLRLLKRFLLQQGTRVRMASVVAMELRAGARTRAQQGAVNSLLDSYVSRARVVVPSFEAFVQSGRVVAELSLKKAVSETAMHRLFSDALLAASCREADVALVTANVREFALIKPLLKGFRFTETDSAIHAL
jgi:predicted nucleic acid-binding protein